MLFRSGAALADVLSGTVPVFISTYAHFAPQIKSGKLKGLAMLGAKRSQFAPSTATFVEQGLTDFVFDELFGFFVPARTPAEVIQRLNAALRQALMAPETISGLAAMGLEAQTSSPAELGQRLRRDHDRWAPLVKQIGFTAEG